MQLQTYENGIGPQYRLGLLASGGVGLWHRDGQGIHTISRQESADEERKTESALWEVFQTDCDAGKTAIDVVCCELRDSWDI